MWIKQSNQLWILKQFTRFEYQNILLFSVHPLMCLTILDVFNIHMGNNLILKLLHTSCSTLTSCLHCTWQYRWTQQIKYYSKMMTRNAGTLIEFTIIFSSTINFSSEFILNDFLQGNAKCETYIFLGQRLVSEISLVNCKIY